MGDTDLDNDLALNTHQATMYISDDKSLTNGLSPVQNWEKNNKIAYELTEACDRFY